MLENSMASKALVLPMLLYSSLSADNLGSLLFHGNCVTCHNETKSISAPSMKKIREKYRSAFKDKKEFVEYMSNWVKEPDARTSLMDGAIKKYKLMPLLGYELETLRDITAYIYDTDFSKKHRDHIY
jgi:cytochrome c551/c552